MLTNRRGRNMSAFIKGNSDESKLHPISVIILLVLVVSIGFSIFNKFCGSLMDKKNISNYDKIEEKIRNLRQENGYDEKSIEEKKNIIIECLTELQSDGLITPDTITYQEDNEIIWYEWGDGYVAGIMLSEFSEGFSGNADKNNFVTKWSTTDSSFPDEWKSEINYSNQSYPFPESDVIDLKLSAKYMFGLCDANNTQSSYYTYLTFYKENKQEWDKNHLSTEIDDYCTVEDFRTGLKGYNLVIIEEHGNYDYNKTPMICTEEKVGDISQYGNDLKNRYIATVNDTSGRTCYWIYPAFFEHYYSDNKLDNTIVWIGSCHGYQNPDLANAFESCGAEAVIGFSESVYTAYDLCLHTAFVYSLMWGDRVSDALYFSKNLFKYSDVDFYTVCGGTVKWYDFQGQWKQHFSPAKAKSNINGESTRLINLVDKGEQGERSVQLTVFALNSETDDPITVGEIEMNVDNPELTCTNPKQTIKSIDGSVVFDLKVNTNSRVVNSKLTWHIDGYKDFTFDNYSFGTDISSMNLCNLMFEKDELEYTWKLEPSIKAEDIIVSDDSNDKYPLWNTEQTERPSDVYSIIQRDGQYALIDYDGQLYNDKFYTSFSMMDYGEIILSSSTPENIDSGNDIIVSYDQSGECKIDEVYVGGRGSAGWDSFYYDYSDKAVHVSGPGDPKNYGSFTRSVNIPIWGEAVNRAVLLNEKGETMYGCYYDGDFTVEPQYNRGKMSFYSDMIAFYDGNKWGYFNGKTGEQIIDFSCNGVAKTYHYMNSDLPPYMYTEGVLAVYNDSGCKYVDAVGNEIIPIGEFEEVRPIHKGLAWVKQNGKWGIIEFTDRYSEDPENQSLSETENAAESLVNKSVLEIVELMDGNFELGYANAVWYTPGQVYFYNNDVFPGLQFCLESLYPIDTSGANVIDEYHDKIVEMIKKEEVDLCLISATSAGKVNDILTVSEGMKYSDLTKIYGNFECNIGGAVGYVTYRIPNTNTILTFEPSDEMSKNYNNLKYYNSTTGKDIVNHAELLYYDPKLLFVNVFPTSKELA